MYDRQIARSRNPKPIVDHTGISSVEALCPGCGHPVAQFAQNDQGGVVLHAVRDAQERKRYGPVVDEVAAVNRMIAHALPETRTVGFERELIRWKLGVLSFNLSPRTLEAAIATYPGPRTQRPGLRCEDGVWRGRCKRGHVFAVPDAKLARLVKDALRLQRGDFYLPRTRIVTGF
jgi:hypothetical protein